MYKSARAESEADGNLTQGPLWQKAEAAASKFAKEFDADARRERKMYGTGQMALNNKKLDELIESNRRNGQLIAASVCPLLLFRFRRH